jgi:MinD-like ATPase involved in chromosome partitioning or flagellar assembly
MVKELAIRIIVGGPPNSGKSTFSESLVWALQDQGVDAESIDLDLWSPTLDYLQGKITKEQRDEQKRKSITIKDAKEAYRRFKDASKEHDIIVGDAPGGISKELKQICKAATHGIIVCRDDNTDQIKVWQNFFVNIGIDVIAVVISKINNTEDITSYKPLKIVLVDLNRQPKITPVLRLFATLLGEKLGI